MQDNSAGAPLGSILPLLASSYLIYGSIGYMSARAVLDYEPLPMKKRTSTCIRVYEYTMFIWNAYMIMLFDICSYMKSSHVMLSVMCWISSLSCELTPHSVVISFEIQVTENHTQVDQLILQVPSFSLSCIAYRLSIEFKV